jgi:hypothetical protein
LPTQPRDPYKSIRNPLLGLLAMALVGVAVLAAFTISDTKIAVALTSRGVSAVAVVTACADGATSPDGNPRTTTNCTVRFAQPSGKVVVAPLAFPPNQLEVGATVTVSYDPQSPSDVALPEALGYWHILARRVLSIVALAISVVIIMLTSVFLIWLRRSRSRG